MPAPDTIDPASLDLFIDTLLTAGFEPAGDQRSWTGPLHPALRPMTDATTMRVVVRDGWPFIQPRIYVGGLPIGRHRNADGDVCLWEIGDPSLEWLTLDGVGARIEKWATEAQGQATADDPGLDPHLTFSGATIGLATIDLSGREIRDWDFAPLQATVSDRRLDIGEGDVLGRWYVRERPKSPPQTLEDLRSQLRRRQRNDMDSALQTVGEPGGVSFLVFAWNTPVGPNLLILRLTRALDAQVKAEPYEAARTDPEILRVRAGPDAGLLTEKSVVVFGVGAIGSHVIDLIARCGIGKVTCYDSQRLRPGDIVRHAASAWSIGDKKVDAMRFDMFVNSRWTRAVAEGKDVWAPTALRAIAAESDLVIDAVGISSFTAQLSRICRRAERPLLSVALYRRGDLGRIRLQSATSDREIIYRADDVAFPRIPPGPDEAEVTWEAGCAAPIAQAPPTSVVGIAASTARLAIELPRL